MRKLPVIPLAGFLAGAVNGLLGTGGGMILIPLLSRYTDLEEKDLFPASLSIIFPICLVSLILTFHTGSINAVMVWPYLTGSFLGGIIAGIWGRKISATVLHRILGVLILWGGFRYLWR